MSATAKGWRDLPRGAVIDEPGNAREYLTGDWRTERPVWNEEKCINCFFCWVYCPDAAILVKDGKVRGVDYAHCKGCGICAAECPKRVQAFTMVKESDAAAADAKARDEKGGCC